MKIKFNLGWILSIAAAVVLAAMGFLSFFYSTGGNLVVPIIVAVCMLALPIVVNMFIVPAKECNRPFYFHQEAVKEASLLAVIIVLLLVSLFLVNHFFTVNSRTQHISKAIADQRNDYNAMFDSYQSYCDQRVETYRGLLIANHADDPDVYVNNLKTAITYPKGDTQEIYGTDNKRWWNLPSELGNVNTVSSELEKAHQALTERDHNPDAPDFDARNDDGRWWTYEIKKADDINAMFTERKGLISNLWTVLSVLIGYLLIMLPYLAAERDSRSKGLFAELKHDPENDDEVSGEFEGIGKL